MDTMIETPTPSTATAGPPRARPGERTLAVAAPVGFFLLLIALWTLVAGRNKSLLPLPSEVWSDGFTNPEVRGRLWSATVQTAKEAAVGLLIAAVLGIAVAALMDRWRFVERAVFPWAVALQTIPILALVPLIKVRYGVGFTPRAIVCVIIAIFPIITNTLFGLLTVDSNLHDLFTLHGAGRLKRLRKLQLPHAIPDIFVGLRVSAGLSVIGAIVGEFFFRQGTPGLGRLLDLYRARLQSDLLMSTLVFCCLLGIAVFIAVGIVGGRLTRAWFEEGGRA